MEINFDHRDLYIRTMPCSLSLLQFLTEYSVNFIDNTIL